MALALRDLQEVGVIHTDVKFDNIMMVDHVNKPHEVKLIDFGLALFSRDAKVGSIVQPVNHR